MAIETSTKVPSETHTTLAFIKSGNKSESNNAYPDFSYIETRDRSFEFIIRNIINDYVYELKELSIEIKLTTDEIYKYKYNPKRLSYDVYGSTKLFFIILLLNDMCNIHQFDLSKKTLYLIPRNVLADSLSKIYISNSTSIAKFNNNHLNDITTKIIEPYRPQR